jgi:hypothetical protein
MEREANIEQLLRYLSEEGGVQAATEEDQVAAEIKTRFDPNSRLFIMEVTLTAKPGFQIANYGTSIGYREPSGKGQSGAYHGGRGWGVAEGPTIRTGIDITVTGTGKRQGSWSVGTFVKTTGGYEFWIKHGTVELG